MTALPHPHAKAAPLSRAAPLVFDIQPM